MDHSDSVEKAILQTQENLRLLLMQHKRENWLQQGNIRIAEILNGDKEIKLFAQELINFPQMFWRHLLHARRAKQITAAVCHGH
jgi:hypothetical protein